MSVYKHDRNKLASSAHVSQSLDYSHECYIQKCRESFPFLPPQWLIGQKDCIEWLSNLQPEGYIEKVTRPILYALNKLLDVNVCLYEDIEALREKVFAEANTELEYELWEFNELLIEIRKVYKYDYSKKLTESRPLYITVCGLLSIFYPATTRGYVFQVRHNTQNAFNVEYSDYLMTDTRESKSLRDVINKSYKDLIQETINVRSKLLNVDRDDIASHMGEAVHNAFHKYKDDPIKGFEASAIGEVNITHIPKRGSDRYLGYHINKRNIEYLSTSLDTPLSNNADLTVRDLLKIEPDLQLLEDRELLGLYINQLPCIDLTEREIQVWSMYHDIKNGQKFTFQDIGNELGVTQERAVAIYHQALKKIRAYFEPIRNQLK